MIRYALICGRDHSFEGWFGSSDDYDDQQGRGLVECPVCANREVRKQIMAPAVAGTKRRGEPDLTLEVRSMVMEAMGKVRQHVEDNFDYVGDSFATEARAIHEGTSEDRGIYGEASAQEIRALTEDGIQIAPLPPAPPKPTELN